MKSIYEQLIEWGSTDPNFEFINYKKSYTINETINEVNMLSGSLKHVDEDHIGILVDSQLDIIFLYIACIKEGKTPILINYGWSSEEINDIIKTYKIKQIITEWSNKKDIVNSCNVYYLEELINSSKGCGIPIDKTNHENPECVIFTSGTAGAPKAVCLDQKNFFASAEAWFKEIRFNHNDKYTLCLPLYHIAGLSILYRAILYKFSIIIIDDYREINSTNGTIVSLIPTLLYRLINDKKYIKILKGYRALIVGGEQASIELLRRCIKLNLNIFLSYGMTETCSGIAGFWVKKYPNKIDSVGMPFKGVNISILNKLITINSPTIMRGYLLENHQSSQLTTSDYGLLDENFLYITGRNKDVAISGGENINIKYVKNVLLKHKHISSVSLNIIKNNDWGESIEADIKVSSNLINEEALRDWCKSKLSKFSIPKRITFN